MQIRHTHAYDLRCRNCGQTGGLWITEYVNGGWAFAPVGFVGLAVNRFNPHNSVIRCNACGSSVVEVTPNASASALGRTGSY